ncbi:MAG: site-specific DNA-methyltransferase [Nitrospirota bacterium]
MPKPKKPSTPAKTGGARKTVAPKQTADFRHASTKTPMRPEVGTQAQFKKKKPPQKYRYDSSLSPALEWDGQNPAREQGEALIKQLSDITSTVADQPTKEMLHSIADGLKALSKPFLNWAGKAERLSFDVPTLPLFIHERLATKAIIETLASHKKDKQLEMLDLFGDPKHSISDQVLKAYEFKDDWVNRMVLGDSLVVMNSLLHYEGLGGQVQVIYMDPPYGVKFGSNFQPFVRKRDVKHNEDDDMTREPEMVKAYRDTWELGLHSYLTYMRDRLLLARDLLTPSGSIFVQISDENLHHVREVMDEVFGENNFVSTIGYRTAIGMTSSTIDQVFDYLVWYSKDKASMKFKRLFSPTQIGKEGASRYKTIESPDGKSNRLMTEEERQDPALIPEGWKAYRDQGLTSRTGSESTIIPFEYLGKVYKPSSGGWRTGIAGLNKLAQANRLLVTGNNLSFKKYFDDFPAIAIPNLWNDTGGGITSRSDPKIYAVQTSTTVIQRCLLMTTDPGDLVLDPTCGSGTTAYVAEQWGRRWITIDTSRVPLALARQRILTATYPYYELKNPELGPAGGFVYKRKRNNKGEEVGGIVPHITLKSIANSEPPQEEVLVDRPEPVNSITRVSGPFCFEATIPTPVDWEGDGVEDSGFGEEYGSFIDRMLEVLRRSPVLHVGGGKTVEFKGTRKPAKTLSLSAEAVVANGKDKPVAILFGPENGAISEKLVFEAAREAYAKNYSHLYVIGFAIQPGARNFIENAEAVVGVAATYVQATPDIMMGDLLKNMRSSQIFSVCGLPEVELKKIKAKSGESERYQVTLTGLDVFEPVTMDVDHYKGDDVPAWFLDSDYNGLCFHVCQAFFPRTAAWDSLKRALRSTHEESVWDHLAGAVSEPFEAGEHGKIAVKVIDDRGNELLVVKDLSEAGK